jgi:hypothetical protein
VALVLADRVKETSTTTGTGTYTLAGAVSGFESFGSIGNGNTTYYACTLGSDFEVGIGTYTSSGTTLARTTILQSSNSDNAVDWGAGTKTLFCTQPAEKAVFLNASDNIELADNSRLRFGNSGSSDLQIWHDGTNSNIVNGTGSLVIADTSGDVKIQGKYGEQSIIANNDGSVELYHDNSKKLETTSSGVTITGTLEANAHRFGDTHVKRISVDYTGGGDYLVDNEFQEILSITPDGNSENYSVVGRIMATSGANVHTLDINVALRSNTLPDLSYSGSYISTITGTIEYLTPRLWVKETSTASFKLVIEVNAQIYGRLNADVEIIARNESDLDNITVNTTEDSEVTSVTTGFTQYSVTKVYETDDGAFAFTDDVSLTGASYNVLWDKSANALEFADNAKSIFGTGNDLQIYHDGSNSYISETGTGHLIINSTGSNLYLRTNTTENSIVGINNGAVELYHDNSKKLETTSTGATITGTLVADGISVGDNENISVGAGNDLRIFHDGTNSRIYGTTGDTNIGQNTFGAVKLTADNDQENMLVANVNGSVDLYHDNSKKLETSSTGATVTGTAIVTDNIQMQGSTYTNFSDWWGSGDNSAFFTPYGYLGSNGSFAVSLFSNGYRNNGGTFTSMGINSNSTASGIELYPTGEIKFRTGTPSGTTVPERMSLTDNTLAITTDFRLTSTDGGATENPTIDLFRNSSSPADQDIIGHITYSGENSASEKIVYGEIQAKIRDVTDATEDGAIETFVRTAGSLDLYTVHQDGESQFYKDVQIISNDSGSTENPTLQLYRNSASPADFDEMGNIDFSGENSAGEKIVYAQIQATSRDVTDATEDGGINFRVMKAGTEVPIIQIGGNTNTQFLNRDIQLMEGVNLIFEGATGNAHETTLTVVDPTADRTITLPNASGTVLLTNGNGSSLTNVNATTLDSVDSTSFLRSDVADTKTSGNLTFSDDVKAVFGTGSDLEIYHDGANSVIKENGTGQLVMRTNGDFVQIDTPSTVMAKFIKNGAVQLRHNNNLKFSTSSTGIEVTGVLTSDGVDVGDNEKIRLGASQDLEIYHDGSNSYIDEGGTGNLYIRAGGNNNISLTDNAVYLYYSGSTKLQTTSDGASITGDLTLTSTDASSSEDPTLKLFRNSASPTGGDSIGHIQFTGNNASGTEIVLAEIETVLGGTTAGSEEGRMKLKVSDGGTEFTVIEIGYDRVQFNEGIFINNGNGVNFEGSNVDNFETLLNATEPTQDNTITLPDASGTVLTTGNSDTPSTTTSSGDADFVLVDDGGVLKKITPSNLGITSGGTTAAFATAMAMVL